MPRWPILLGALGLLGCHSASSSGTPDGSSPPAPYRPAVLDPALEAQLPHADGGLPILLDLPVAALPGLKLQVVFDAKRDDPLTRWGECLGRALACYKTNPGPVRDCIVHRVERCADDAGGTGCCPQACLDAYAAAYAGGASEEAALEQSILAGDCVPGLRGLLDGGSP